MINCVFDRLKKNTRDILQKRTDDDFLKRQRELYIICDLERASNILISYQN